MYWRTCQLPDPWGRWRVTTPSPIVTGAGEFGGDVLALQLNVDFSDVGIIGGTAGFTFGDVVLQNFTGDLASLNGLSVRQYLEVANHVLGGGTSSIPNPIGQLAPVTDDLTNAFMAGHPSAFAAQYLAAPSPGIVAEPTTVAMLGCGLIAILSARRRSAW